jgi:hypothetical protein
MFKTTRAKSAGGVVQVIEYLLSGCKALSSNFSTIERKKRKPCRQSS